MKVTTLKTHKIKSSEQSITSLLDKYITHLQDGSIVVVTSKIVALCEGRVAKESVDKAVLVKKESEYFLSPTTSKYNITLTIKRNLLIPTAGIDESNANGMYVLWPKDPQKSANTIREYLSKKFQLRRVGVIVSDSRTIPLRWGTIGVSIAHSGFRALNNYIGKPDIFGRKLEVTKANVADALACSAVVMMGEGKEQTPLAIIEDVPFVHFQDRNPTKKELNTLKIKLEDDLYYPLIKNALWQKGDQA
jgi:dihydrofolate synthase / folylpolyglutamate synthase